VTRRLELSGAHMYRLIAPFAAWALVLLVIYVSTLRQIGSLLPVAHLDLCEACVFHAERVRYYASELVFSDGACIDPKARRYNGLGIQRYIREIVERER
jgi:hypothetical protein